MNRKKNTVEDLAKKVSEIDLPLNAIDLQQPTIQKVKYQ
jgi:hypothetical protein